MGLHKKFWRDVRSEVHAVNPKLAEIIDKIDPPDDCFFYEAEYQYGEYIIENGGFKLPEINGKRHSLFDQDAPKEVVKEIGYNYGSNPAVIVLEHTVELFVSVGESLVPSYLFYPGDVFGFTLMLKQKPQDLDRSRPSASIWEMTAGGRSTFILPKICDALGHKRIERHFNFNVKKPSELMDHWPVFREIAKKAAPEWKTRLLYLSRNWFNRLADPDWAMLKIYLMDATQSAHIYWMSFVPISLAFAKIHHLKNIESSSIVTDIVKNLFAVGSGAVPGLQPAIDDIIVPNSTLQEVYSDIYRLEEFSPTVMQPVYFGRYNNERPVYTSLHYMPVGGVFKLNKIHSSYKFLDEIQYILNKHIDSIRAQSETIDAPYIDEVTKNVNFDFFHYLPKAENSFIQDSKIIPEEDDSFKVGVKNDKKVAYASKFFKGCVRIAPKAF
ncbi:MAG: hypothetical protein K0Q57_683 [Gammaproteobacteria bacterium]|jgi:hypothetical protein|nr:hypothetical protein [Gammaproteobacteria bacterium]